MAVDTAIFELITNQSEITDLVSTRVYPLFRQEKELPAITYRKVSSVREYTDDGQISLFDQNFDLFLFSKSKDELENLLSTVESQIDEAFGTFGTEQIKYVKIISSGGNEDYISESKVYTDSLEIKVTFIK